MKTTQMPKLYSSGDFHQRKRERKEYYEKYGLPEFSVDTLPKLA